VKTHAVSPAHEISEQRCEAAKKIHVDGRVDAFPEKPPHGSQSTREQSARGSVIHRNYIFRGHETQRVDNGGVVLEDEKKKLHPRNSSLEFVEAGQASTVLPISVLNDEHFAGAGRRLCGRARTNLRASVNSHHNGTPK
jgi:hypothetical protein